MTFNSVVFLFLFLPAVLLGNVLMAGKLQMRKYYLTLASFLFYGWCNTRILLFLIVFGLVHYWLGRLLDCCAERQEAKKLILLPGIALDILCLFFTKYLNYAISLGNSLLGMRISLVSNLLVPLGISFLCFSMIAYQVDVYQKKAPAFRSMVDFFLYLSFFPKVSQGPIARHDTFAEDLLGKRVSLDTFTDGLRRFIAGLGKKVLLADVLGSSVDLIYGNLATGITAGTAWLGILCYTLQIYYDFSGYTDMAIGIGKMLGFRLPENFQKPYLSKSVSEFWRRWHITLGMWFREYVYIPMGGNRRGFWRTLVNLLAVWLLTGIWHGASTHFVVWGIYFGCFVILEKCISPKAWYQKIPVFVRWLATFLIVMMGWVIFRSGSMSEAMLYFKALMVGSGQGFFKLGYYFDLSVYLAIGVGIVLTLPQPRVQVNSKALSGTLLAARDVWLLLVLLTSIVFMMNSTYQSFIYFQF